MATVSVLQSPHSLEMASRRAPLTNLPHAANSPLRPAAGKRARADAQAPFDGVNVPPPKRQLLDLEDREQDRENVPPQPHTPHKKKAVSSLDARLAKYAVQPEVADRERAVRHANKNKAREAPAEIARGNKQRTNETRHDDISRWQRYYEKQFPRFVFYFENVPEDARRLCSRQVRELGAAEDRFFSRAVTHIITTRAMPSGGATAFDDQQAPSAEEIAQQQGTINPSLLDRRNRVIDELAGAGRTRYNFDAALSKKAGLGQSPEKATNKLIAAKGDVLVKAKDLGIKIWQLEKLQRILKVMYADDEATEALEQEPSRAGKVNKQTNLSQLIKNEERSQAGNRELGPMQTELVPLTEPYIFIRDMNEKTKPLMVRQYSKVSKSEDGDWPQFRPVTQGKCPFIIEEPRRRSTEKAEEASKKERAEQRMTRAQAAAESQQKRPAVKAHDETRVQQHQKLLQFESQIQRHALAELAQEPLRGARDVRHGEPTKAVYAAEDETPDQTDENRSAEDATTDAPQITPTMPTEATASRSKAEITSYASHSRQTSIDLMAPPAALPLPNPGVGAPGGEPLASGMQKSGMTSAIRSQMGISSTAAAPGIKAGTSRDIHSLQRRILERKSTGSGSTLGMSGAPAATVAAAVPTATISQATSTGLMHSRGMLDIASRARAENPRAAKTKAVEKLNIHGRTLDQFPMDDRTEAPKHRGEEKERQRTKLRREPKPGYCENCRDKFDDFELHTQSRKHRKFALTKENWSELDALLSKLERPLKDKKRKRNEYEEEVV